jgi:hypothetical protein
MQRGGGCWETIILYHHVHHVHVPSTLCVPASHGIACYCMSWDVMQSLRCACLPSSRACGRLPVMRPLPRPSPVQHAACSSALHSFPETPRRAVRTVSTVSRVCETRPECVPHALGTTGPPFRTCLGSSAPRDYLAVGSVVLVMQSAPPCEPNCQARIEGTGMRYRQLSCQSIREQERRDIQT